jgi:hypothetical protein
MNGKANDVKKNHEHQAGDDRFVGIDEIFHAIMCLVYHAQHIEYDTWNALAYIKYLCYNPTVNLNVEKRITTNKNHKKKGYVCLYHHPVRKPSGAS